MFVSEVQRKYLDVPGISVIADVGMMCVQCAPYLPKEHMILCQ